jgi:hypothetical protein
MKDHSISSYFCGEFSHGDTHRNFVGLARGEAAIERAGDRDRFCDRAWIFARERANTRFVVAGE